MPVHPIIARYREAAADHSAAVRSHGDAKRLHTAARSAVQRAACAEDDLGRIVRVLGSYRSSTRAALHDAQAAIPLAALREQTDLEWGPYCPVCSCLKSCDVEEPNPVVESCADSECRCHSEDAQVATPAPNEPVPPSADNGSGAA